jgi:hypothetical protein
VLEDSDQPDRLCTIKAQTLELLSLLVHDLAEQNMIAMIWARCSESRRRLKQVLGCLIMLQKTPDGKTTRGRIDKPFRRQLQLLENLISKVCVTKQFKSFCGGAYFNLCFQTWEKSNDKYLTNIIPFQILNSLTNFVNINCFRTEVLCVTNEPTFFFNVIQFLTQCLVEGLKFKINFRMLG